MKNEVAIQVNDVKKDFILPHQVGRGLSEKLFGREKKEVQHALRGISFDVKKGEFFGILGRNGSGKSTLLKILAEIYRATSGSVEVSGKLVPFIELGVGFHPELSGRENVYLNGAMLGFSNKEMDKKYKSIVDFAELEKSMDQKLKNYSSGMQVRLAFSVATRAEADILLIDEVLAVGDEAFQKKCVDVFEDYKVKKQTVVLVTHDMTAVKKFCDRAILIEDGVIIAEGDPTVIADKYSELNQQVIDAEVSNRNKKIILKDGGGVETKVYLDGVESMSFGVYDDAEVDIVWDKKYDADSVLLDIFKKDGEHVTNFVSRREGVKSLIGKKNVRIKINLNLTPGSYYFAVALLKGKKEKRLVTVNPIYEFIVKDDWSKAKHKFAGTTKLSGEWFFKE